MPLIIEIEAQDKARLRAEAELRGVFIEEEIGRRLFFPISADGELMRDGGEFPIVEETEWGSRTHFGIKVIPPESERMSGGQRFVQFLLGAVPISLVGYVADQNVSSNFVKGLLILLAIAPAFLFAVGAMHWWRNRRGQVRAIENLEIPLVLQIEPQTEARLRAGAERRGVSVESEIARRLSLSTLTGKERES